MRKHGAAARHCVKMAASIIEMSMWSLRALRQAREGDIVVAGPHGEVLRVDFVAIDKSWASVSCTCLAVPPYILAKTGPRWVQEDMKILGDAPSSVEGHVARDRPLPAAPGQRAGTNLPRKAKATGAARRK